ncbi:MAG: Type pilus assembly protein PilM, type pilus assembly protein PilM [Patescibacteria group bacterium]|nr:Type pilus assembly protein PilM, type pilus assembly protein PilM [Patescibacteria group bacterium]
MSFLQDILAKGQSLLKFTPAVNSVVGIDIGTSAIKIVQVTRDGGKIKLETYGEIGLGSYANDKSGKVVTLAPEVIAKAITDLLRESNVTTKNAVISIQSQATLIFLLELPEVKDSELATLIPNEARKYIPVPLTEVSLDWYVVPKAEFYVDEVSSADSASAIRKKNEVVVVAVRNETLSQYAQIADKSGIVSRGNEIEIFSAIRSVFHREITPTLVIDYGAGTTKVSIVEYGVVRAYHVINRGSAFTSESLARSKGIDFDKAEELKKTVGLTAVPGQEEIAKAIETDTAYIVSEIQTILMGYERQSHKSVTKILLCGGGSMMPGFLEKISQTFGVETVFGNPFGKAEAPQFMEPVLKKAGPEFTVAMGLALKDFV